MSNFTFHVSCVTCQVSGVICQVSGVIIITFFVEKTKELVGREPIINRAYPVASTKWNIRERGNTGVEFAKLLS